MSKQIIRKKEYTITHIVYDNGTGSLERNNNGFSVLELLGLLSIAKKDLEEVFYQNTIDKYPKPKRVSKNSPIIHKEGEND